MPEVAASGPGLRAILQDGAYTQLDEMTGLRSFIATLADHIAAEATR